MIQKISLIANAILVATSLLLGSVLFLGCNTFKVITVKDETSACNRFYTVLSFYSSIGKGQDAAFVGTVYNDCSESDKEKRTAKKESDCRDLYFGKDAVIDKTKYDKYTGFLECIKNK